MKSIKIARIVKPQTEAAESKLESTEAEFRQLCGNGNEGTFARFLQNKLNVLFWYRSPREPALIFGSQLQLSKLIDGLRGLIRGGAGAQSEICVALLDDSGKPVQTSREGFSANWKAPFVSTEIGEALPHWESAVYLVDPGRLARSVRALQWTLTLLVAALVTAISLGGWSIVSNLRRELKLARQKTDFVGNVSHELKTPLTSIRMFSELLAQGGVTEAKRISYLHIIAAEAARLTRLINNVLDFAALERGRKYRLEDCEVCGVVREALEAYRPHLEENGFSIRIDLPDKPLPARGDKDALVQVVVNLLSNAEKYGGDKKEIRIEAAKAGGCIEVRVMDRGPGVRRGYEARIFEKFFRAHDALDSGAQGSGLGLTLARQIARAHGGDLEYTPRAGGGSCFTLRLPFHES
jgi:signal transduction histidine kinase